MAPTAETICVAPLSSPYSLLPRAHTYALVLALFLPLPKGWIFRAALAAFTTRNAIFAIDSFRLYGTLRNHPAGPVHVDILVATESLTLASIVAAWLLTVSRRGAQSGARELIQIWGFFVAIGTIVGFVALRDLAHVETHGECREIRMEVLDIFGKPRVYGAGFGTMGGSIGYFITRVGTVGILFAAIAIVSCIVPRERALLMAAVPRIAQRRRWHNVNPYASHLIQFDEPTAHTSGRMLKWVRLLLMVAIPAMATFVIVSVEWYFQRLAPDVPSVEKMSSVGQWGVWAATGVVIFATAGGAWLKRFGLTTYVDPLDHAPPQRHKELIRY